MHTTRLGAWEPGGTALATARGRATTRACQLQPPQWSSAQVSASPHLPPSTISAQQRSSTEAGAPLGLHTTEACSSSGRSSTNS